MTISRDDVAIIDIRLVVVFGSIAPFFTSRPRVVTLAAFQTEGAFVCVHDYRAVFTV